MTRSRGEGSWRGEEEEQEEEQQEKEQEEEDIFTWPEY